MPHPALVALAVVATTTIALMLGSKIRSWFSPRWSPRGQLVLVTGGSQGLGLALAEQLAAEGASVVIVARREAQLIEALEQVRRSTPLDAYHVKHQFIVGDVSTFEGAAKVLAALPRAPDTVICAAGGANPGLFLDMTAADFEQGIKTNYMTTLATVHAAAKRMRNEQVQGNIVLVSSMVAFCGLIGYAQYQPMKAAVKGLAETLRSEFLLYGIQVHCYFPATILSPGFENEQKTKPAVLREIEEADGPQTPEQCAKGMLRGLRRGHFNLTSDWQTDLFRALNSRIQPGNGLLVDALKSTLASIALPVWRNVGVDAIVRKYRSTPSAPAAPAAS